MRSSRLAVRAASCSGDGSGTSTSTSCGPLPSQLSVTPLIFMPPPREAGKKRKRYFLMLGDNPHCHTASEPYWLRFRLPRITPPLKENKTLSPQSCLLV